MSRLAEPVRLPPCPQCGNHFAGYMPKCPDCGARGGVSVGKLPWGWTSRRYADRLFLSQTPWCRLLEFGPAQRIAAFFLGLLLMGALVAARPPRPGAQRSRSSLHPAVGVPLALAFILTPALLVGAASAIAGRRELEVAAGLLRVHIGFAGWSRTREFTHAAFQLEECGGYRGRRGWRLVVEGMAGRTVLETSASWEQPNDFGKLLAAETGWELHHPVAAGWL